MDALFDKMANSGLISFSNTWIERAIKDCPSRIDMRLAHSRLMTLDVLDKFLLLQGNQN